MGWEWQWKGRKSQTFWGELVMFMKKGQVFKMSVKTPKRAF